MPKGVVLAGPQQAQKNQPWIVPMPSHNADIAATFEEIANLLEIEGANPYRIRAYRNAARTIAELSTEAYAMVEKGEDLTRFPGIGADLSVKINEIISTGHCALLDRLRTELPAAVTELLKVPGLGPKRVRHLYHDLDVQTVEQCLGSLPFLIRSGRPQQSRLSLAKRIQSLRWSHG